MVSLYTNQKVSPTADLKQYMSALQKNLGEPGRSKALLAHVFATNKAACAARIPEITSKSIPTIAVYGKNDPDFAPMVDAEVSEMNRRFSAVLKAPPLCLDGLGHYPHVENPRAVAEAVLSFVTAGSTA